MQINMAKFSENVSNMPFKSLLWPLTLMDAQYAMCIFTVVAIAVHSESSIKHNALHLMSSCEWVNAQNAGISKMPTSRLEPRLAG